MFLGGKVPAPSGWTLTCDCTGAEITCWDHGIFRVSFTHRDGLEQERGWLKSRPSPSRVVLASCSDSEKEMFAKLKGQTSGPLCQPNALLNVLCSACWSWDPVASRREEDSFLYEWPNDRCTIFCPRKACQVVGISGWPVLNKIQEKFHLVNPGEVPGFCFCVLFFLL